MKYRLKIACLLSAGIFFAPFALAYEDFAQTGFTGVLRTPNTEVVPYGHIRFSNSWEENIDYDRAYRFGAHNTAILGIGLLPGFELITQNGYKRFEGNEGFYGGSGSDLSFAAKFTSKALIPDSLFQLAAGVQDYGTHSATFHKNYYIVSSAEFSDVTVNIGYGQGDIANQMGRKYLDGDFASINWKLTNHIAALVDFDGTGFNTGFRFNTKSRWLPKGWRVGLTWQFDSSSDTSERDNQYVGLSLNIDLNKKKQEVFDAYRYDPLRPKPPPQLTAQPKTAIQAQKPYLRTTVNNTDEQNTGLPNMSSPLNIADQKRLVADLAEEGFENIRLGDRKSVV